jgi:LysR family transcriptional regulator for metE and metH
MNHLEIKHLRMICAIAETGNMTKAAEKLFLSQSALSQQLKDIEGKLKVGLFFRTSKKMILTETGKALLKTAQQVIGTLADTELEIAKLASGESGELKVGTQCIFCYKWLPRVMEIFQKKFPNIEFEIGNSNDPVEELESKKYNFIITAVFEPEEQLTYLPLFEDQMVCIMPKDHPLSVRSHVHFEDFNAFNLLSHAEKDKNKFYQLGLKPKGVEPRRFMTVGHPVAIIEMVASGFGLSIFPRWAISSFETDTITARPISKNGLPLTWTAAYLNNSQLPVFQAEFINIVRQMHFMEGL